MFQTWKVATIKTINPQSQCIGKRGKIFYTVTYLETESFKTSRNRRNPLIWLWFITDARNSKKVYMSWKLMKSAQPAIITGRKWNMKHAVETAESSLKMKEVISSVATGRAGFGLHPQRWWSKEITKNKRRMVSEEIHHFEESKRLAIAVAQTRCTD